MSLSGDLEYLNQNNLHLTPISARIFSGVRFLATAMHQCASPSSWHGHLVRGLAKGVIIVGYTVNTPFAVAEVVTTLTVGLLAALVHLFTQARSTLLQKYTIKCLAYCINSAAVTFIQIYGIMNWRFPIYHTWNAIGNHMIYLGSAALIHMIVGACFDHIAGRNPEDRNAQVPAIDRILTFVWDHTQESVVHDVMNGMERDFGVSQVLRNFANIPTLQRFYQAFPQHQTLLRDFQVSRLTDSSYRDALLTVMIDIGTYYHLLERTPGNNLEVIVNVHTDAIKKYQKHLQGCVKQAYRDIYNNEELCFFLGSDAPQSNQKTASKGDAAVGKDSQKVPSRAEQVAAGRDRLGFCDHDTILPLSHLTQLKELETTNVCPEQFVAADDATNSDLREYNSRRAKIEAAGTLLAAYFNTTNENSEKIRLREILIRKLIYCASYDAEIQKLSIDVRKQFVLTDEQVKKLQPLFMAITNLGGALHQGKLMSQLTVDIRNGNFSGNNLFTKAIQEAYNEAETAKEKASKKSSEPQEAKKEHAAVTRAATVG